MDCATNARSGQGLSHDDPAISYQFVRSPAWPCANNEDAVSVDTVAQPVLADGMGGITRGGGQRHGHHLHPVPKWGAGLRRQASTSRRRICGAIEICVDNANQAILGAAESNPQYMAWAPRWWWGVPGDTSDAGAYWRFALLPVCAKGAGTDHARPFPGCRSRSTPASSRPAGGFVSSRNLVTRAGRGR